MLVVQLEKETECESTPIKKRLRKKKNNDIEYPSRQNIKINNKPVCVLHIREKDLDNYQVQKLLNNYRGKVLVPEKNKDLFDANILFNTHWFFQRALLSSLIKHLHYIDAVNRSVFIKVDSFKICDEFYEIVRLSKKVVFCTADCEGFQIFRSLCYEKFGAVIVLKAFSCYEEYGIVMDLDLIDEQGKLIIDFLGKNTLIYPDATFFYTNETVQRLVYMGVEEKTASAAADYMGVR